ncbi:MAG: hypothetical protein KDA80_20030, partial [Planctomycetaceae bacterium]|nr:hypothetical protein [Planctomycetaceae bacterium]
MLLRHWLQGVFPFARHTCHRVNRNRKKQRTRNTPWGRSFGSEQLEDRTLLTTLFVDTAFANVAIGVDPDGAGPASRVGRDAFGSLQAAIDNSQAGDTIVVAAGVYRENISIGHSLKIDGSDLGGVVIAPVSGDGLTLSGTATVSLDDLSISAVRGTGISMLATGSQRLSVNLRNLAVTETGGDAISVVAASGGTIGLTGDAVSGNSAGRDGLHIESIDAIVHVEFTGVGSFADAGRDAVNATITGGAANDFQLALSGENADFSHAGRDGLSLAFENFSNTQTVGHNFVLEGLDFSHAANNGFTLIGTGATASRTTTFRGLVLENNFDFAGQHAWDARIAGNHPASLVRFENTMMRDAGQDAIHIEARDHSLLDVEVIDGNLLRSGDDNVEIIQDRESRVDIFIDPTPMDRGFEFDGDNGTVLNAHILDSPLSTTALPADFGILGTLTGGATMNLKVENSIIEGALVDGINVTAEQGSTFNATFIRSQIAGSGRSGMNLQLDTGSKAVMNFTEGSTITDSNGSNVVIVAKNGSQADITFDATSGDLSGAGKTKAGDGLFIISNNAGSAVNVTFQGAAKVDNVSRDALSMNSNFGGRVNVYAKSGLSVSNAGDNAVSVFGNGANATLVASGVQMDNAGGNAVQAFSGSGSRIVMILDAVSSIRNAGSDAIAYNVSNSFLSINMSGTAADPMNLDNAAGSGIDGKATNKATTVFKFNYFTIDSSLQDGFRLFVDDATMLTSTFDNGSITNNGQSGVVSSGLAITAVNQANIGRRATVAVPAAFGLLFNNVDFGNSPGVPEVQDHGMKIDADGDSFVKIRMLNGDITSQANHGVVVVSNSNNSAADKTLVDLTFSKVNINDNLGDGVNLEAYQGTDTLTSQTSGIIFNFSVGQIANNGSGILFDDLGDGIDALADGDPTGIAGNTTICLNLTNADVFNNEELQFHLQSVERGNIKQMIGGGTFSGPVQICADGMGSSASFGLNNVRILPSTDNGGNPDDAAIALCAKNGGTTSGSFSNMNVANGTAISGHGAQAVVFLAETGGTVLADFTNVDMVGNLLNSKIGADSLTGLPVSAAVQGVVRDANSKATANFTNVSITGHSKNGFEVDAINGGSFTSKITNLTLANNKAALGEGEFDVDVNGLGSRATLAIDGLVANGSTGRGIDIQATNNSVLTINGIKNSSATNAAQDGLNIIVTSGSVLSGPLEISNSKFDVAKNGDGVNLEFTGAASPVDLSLTSVSANTARRNGVDIDLGLSSADGTHTVLVNNVTANFAQGGRGLEITTNSKTFNANDHIDVIVTGGSSFNNALVSGVDIRLLGADGSTAKVDINSVTANDAVNNVGVNVYLADGIDSDSVSIANVTAKNSGTLGGAIRSAGATTSLTNVVVTDSDFSGTRNGSGLSVVVDKQNSPVELSVTNVLAKATNNYGVLIDLNQTTGGLSKVNIQGVNASGAKINDGLQLHVTGLAGTDTLDVNIGNGSDFSRAGIDGMDLLFGGGFGSKATLQIDGVTANTVGMTAVNVMLGDSIELAIPSLNNVTASGAGTLGLNVNALGNTTLTSLISSMCDFSGAMSTAVNVMIDVQGVPAFVSFADLTADDAGGKGVDIELDTVTGGMSSVQLVRVSATNAGAGEGLDLDVTSLGVTDSVDIDIMDCDFSGAGM